MVAANQQSAARAVGHTTRAGSSLNSHSRNVRAAGNWAPRHPSENITANSSCSSVRAAASRANSGSDRDDILFLNDENAALRATLQARLDKLDEAQRNAFYAEHAELAELATGAGVNIPLLDGAPAPTAPKKERKKKEAAPPTAGEASPVPVAKAPVVMKDAGVAAVVEVDRDNTLVFKFGSSETPSLSVVNSSKASSMAADGLPANGAVRPGRTSKAAGAKGGDSEKESKVYKFDTKIAASVPATTSAPATTGASSDVTAAAAISATDASSGSSGSESDGGGKSTKSTTRRRKSTSSTSSSSTKSAAKKSTKKADPFAAARAAATAEAQSHSPATALEGKEYWLYATVPATPVAGALCTFYFNKAQSEVLRQSPRIQLQARFNNWELEPAGDAPDHLDMIPAAEGAPRGDGSDFYSISFTVPIEAYEFNFIFSDGESLFDNNNTQNYTLPVEGPVTKESWIDTAPERAEAAYLARKENERVAAEKAAAERETAALAADAQSAENTINELKSSYMDLRDGVLDLKSDQQRIRISSPTTGIATAGSKIWLMYNRTAPGGALSGIPVPADQMLTLRIGHNGWKSPQDIEMQRAPASSAKSTGDGTAEWWQAVVDVPESAAALNFVVNYYEHFDNNNAADYKIAVELPSNAKSVEAWADDMLKDVLKGITASRHAKEKAAADLEEARAAAREAVRAKTEQVRRKQIRHVLYTEPSAPAAGKELNIAYNPSNTNLNGAERVFIKGGYNRWTHPKGYGSIEMTPPASGASHFTAVVSVPKDAYSLDFVFSDVVDGDGRYDNRGGLDYHMPVEGSVVGEPPLYVVHVAAEMAPIAKVGGLGDVVTALGRAVQEAGNQVEVILPRYDFFLQSPLLGGTQYETEFEWEGQRVFVSSCIVEGLRCWFIEPSNGMFATSTVYQGASDAAKFSWFSRAALEFLLRTQRQPDIVHCHDWSTAEVAKNYWTNYHIYGLWKPKVVFTIHNLNYGAAAIGEAAYYSQKFTTVSPSYAGEIGDNPAIASNSGKLSGIRNGIDIDIWNPETDQFLPEGYTADNVDSGKAAARKALRQRVNLTEWGDKPLVGVVTRLTKQKGTHLIAHSVFRAMDRGAQFVLLGSAPDPKVQAEFDSLAQQYGGDNAAFCFAFDEPLSHLIYAACDIILVPSMFEPCGLTQMIAMRYGAVPVVRSTGGLRDTVFDVDTDKARAAWELEGSTDWESDGVDQTNGFSFEGTDEGALDYAMNRALDAYYNDREWFRSLQERVMRQDWSWNKPAIDYVELYYAAMK